MSEKVLISLNVSVIITLPTKNDKGEQKGFSFRRTIKTLQEAKKLEPVMEFWENLQGKGEQKDGDGN